MNKWISIDSPVARARIGKLADEKITAKILMRGSRLLDCSY
ncbi:hypothetical protein F0L16_12315 [Photorhabdus heterorhabditis]|uniref:Uncharacterized protein n=1 Tax=Photorhabdus heterorhabditis TaxID=880156 RepID=A0A5B0WM89_9GAMM|nr:hypothetical protein F0L16_12315 [Photorhabdus heterorhabditis]MBS9440230.1 hypothetical protein [Photorhabdus heterorhabditis]NRN27764.1 hypothetical protein [Photorhabdus heterorhabditis subsp. aluminescens]